MKTLIAKCSLSLFLLASVIVSCKKDGNPEENSKGYGNVSYFAKAAVPGIKTATVKSDSAASSINVAWASATVYVEKIAFAGTTNNLLDTTITVEKNLNILSADALAGVIKLPAGAYKDVKVKMFLRKFNFPQLALNLRGTFTNTQGGKDSIVVASSVPIEVNFAVPDMVIDASATYNVIFNFDINKTLTGISTGALTTTIRPIIGADNKKTYYIWKGGSSDEPFYNQVIQNWQSVVSVTVSK